MLKQLTEALCRHLLGTTLPINPAATAPSEAAGFQASSIGDSASPKVSLFLSHAKADGTTPARRIRDYIYSQTQLAAFYDENDIPFGSAFSRVLESSLRSSQTAALIAVRSARYASRPWCRRELSLFRRPRRESNEGELPERWRLQPMLVVDALEPGARTVGIPEMGNATLIRWSDDAPDLEEQIVTTVLRDALLAAFHSSLGRSLASAPDSVILNWLPDPTTLLHIPVVRDASIEATVVYPGRGLSGLELDTLAEYFPQVTFRSFDQAKP
ncbi:toll/interleukin-1 receptor domain-containing protein [uncultured Piscinibacter sp.]|uniref:toll/interleukin-1 receptor domain-containing protein n=1 Tax=uncultured Piscinibacter sp. TaxID=1131835 RepID=UPI0026085775|nr:toll/interleukin-1 receptor domain-containing protein [uncultured Piscinibacter sp.]